jgi:hypothetical protein
LPQTHDKVTASKVTIHQVIEWKHNVARAEYNRQGGAGLVAEPSKSPGVILFA